MGRIKAGTFVEPRRAKRNERERNRVNQINDQYEVLREVIDRAESYPSRRRKLTRTEIVYEAIATIRNLERMLGIEGSSEYNLPDLHDHQSKMETSSSPHCSSLEDWMCSSESSLSSPPHVNEMMPSSLQPQQTSRKIGKKRKFKAQQQEVAMETAFAATSVITGWPVFDYTTGYYGSSLLPSGIPAESMLVGSQSEVPAKMARMISPPAPEFPTRYYEVTPSPSNIFDSPEMMPQPEMTNVCRVASPVSDFIKYPEVASSPPSDAVTFVEMKPAPQTETSLEMARMVTPPASQFKTTYYAAASSPRSKTGNSEMRRPAMFKIEPTVGYDGKTNVGLFDDGYSFSEQHMEMMSYFLVRFWCFSSPDRGTQAATDIPTYSANVSVFLSEEFFEAKPALINKMTEAYKVASGEKTLMHE
ncbi:unnamed protein product, partial [Mesorhabditis belari]|uniref:BHLH domain-containing protein n=1 Tax=Mesorhabditis belari TaxID=2138241 RepID=A0AAF3FMR7_9BILA